MFNTHVAVTGQCQSYTNVNLFLAGFISDQLRKGDGGVGVRVFHVDLYPWNIPCVEETWNAGASHVGWNLEGVYVFCLAKSKPDFI